MYNQNWDEQNWDEQDWEEARKRAMEALNHRSRHTFIAPESMLRLITVHEGYMRLWGLLKKHYAAAQGEGRGYNEHDDWLWSQAFKWYE